MFLARRCLTYFLRLLQCSPPLYREKKTHTHTRTQRFLNHSPTSTPVPPPLSQVGGIAPVGPAQDAPSLAEHQKTFTWANQGQRGEFCPEVLCTCVFYVIVAIPPYEDINDVSNIVTTRLRKRGWNV